MHIGSSSQMPADLGRRAGRGHGHAELQQRDGVADRLPVLGRARPFPNLKLAYSEGQIGWMPYVLERADDVWSSTGRGAA